MKRYVNRLIAGAMLLLAGCANHPSTITISGAPGTAFTGICNGTDLAGRPLSENLSGNAPKEFMINSRHFDFKIKKETETDNLTVTIRKGNDSEAIAAADSQQHGVEGKIRWWGLTLNTY